MGSCGSVRSKQSERMPSGVPVATVAIGGGRNAGLLAVQILAVSEPALQKKVLRFKDRLAEECLADERVGAVDVAVHKPSAPVQVTVDDIVVRIRRTR